MEKEFLFTSTDSDQVVPNFEAANGTASILFMQGSREDQQDALWVGLEGDQVIACSSDGVSHSANGAEMSAWVVEFARASAVRQLRECGLVDPRLMQENIRDGINERASLHRGRATALCLVIDQTAIRAHRVGDPDTMLDSELYPHGDLAPENRPFAKFRSWWEEEGHGADPLEQMTQLGQARGRLLEHSVEAQDHLLVNSHGGYDTDASEALVSPWTASLVLRPKERFLAGTDGLEGVRLYEWYRRNWLDATDPQAFLTALRDELTARKGENASGLAFFRNK